MRKHYLAYAGGTLLLLASLATLVVAGLLIAIGFVLLNATGSEWANQYAQYLGIILGAVFGVLFLIVGIIMAPVTLLSTLWSAKIIKNARLEGEAFLRKRGFQIFYLVWFSIITFLSVRFYVPDKSILFMGLSLVYGTGSLLVFLDLLAYRPNNN